MAASDPRPLLPVLAGEDPFGAGAAQGSADHCTADQQVGGTLEGIWLCVRLILVSHAFGSGSGVTKLLVLSAETNLRQTFFFKDGSVALVKKINQNKHKQVESIIVIESYTKYALVLKLASFLF